MSTREIFFNVGGYIPGDVAIIQPGPRVEGEPQPPAIPILIGAANPAGHGVLVGVDPNNRGVGNIPDEDSGGAEVWVNGKLAFRIILPPRASQFSAEAGEPPQLPPEYGGDADRVAIHFDRFRVARTLPQPEIRGRYFWINGQRSFLNMATGFHAYGRLLQAGAAAIRPVFQQRQDLGFNAFRMATAYSLDRIGRLIPAEVPDYYARLQEIFSLGAEYGQYPYVDCYFGANPSFFSDRGAMISHQLQLEQAILAAGSWPLLSLHNEFNHPLNQYSAFIGPTPPASILWSQGSNMQDNDPPQPYGRFASRHPASSAFQRKVGKQSADFLLEHNLQIPCGDEETVRMDPNSAISRRQMHDAGAMAAFFCASSCYHSDQAKRFELWSGPELDRAAGWCEGVRSVPLDIAQEGVYSHPASEEGERSDGYVIRVFRKTLGGRSHTVVVYGAPDERG